MGRAVGFERADACGTRRCAAGRPAGRRPGGAAARVRPLLPPPPEGDPARRLQYSIALVVNSTRRNNNIIKCVAMIKCVAKINSTRCNNKVRSIEQCVAPLNQSRSATDRWLICSWLICSGPEDCELGRPGPGSRPPSTRTSPRPEA